jgi:hypothetical protein
MPLLHGWIIFLLPFNESGKDAELAPDPIDYE